MECEEQCKSGEKSRVKEKGGIVREAHTEQREAISKGRFKRDKKYARGREERIKDTKRMARNSSRCFRYRKEFFLSHSFWLSLMQ